MTKALDQSLLAAHAAHDRPALVTLYTQAAENADTPEARGFFLTHAYVYALELGDPRAEGLHKTLCEMHRDA